MRSIIEELYYGNINPSNLCCSDAERKFVDIAASQQKCCGAVFSYRGYCGILWCFFGNCSYILSDATLYKKHSGAIRSAVSNRFFSYGLL